jgi:hypothetical protein
MVLPCPARRQLTFFSCVGFRSMHASRGGTSQIGDVRRQIHGLFTLMCVTVECPVTTAWPDTVWCGPLCHHGRKAQASPSVCAWQKVSKQTARVFACFLLRSVCRGFRAPAWCGAMLRIQVSCRGGIGPVHSGAVRTIPLWLQHQASLGMSIKSELCFASSLGGYIPLLFTVL